MIRYQIFVTFVIVIACANGMNDVGKGKFESFNGYRYTEAKSLDDTEGTKLFLNRITERKPPAHDTV